MLLSFVFAVTWFTSTAMAAHLPRLLQASGPSLQAAVALAALVGPAEVAARLLEFGLLRRLHPVLSAKLGYKSKNPVNPANLTAEQMEEVEAFLSAIDGNDDVQNVFVGLAG